jgi:plasmid stabilization system protein ParE
MRFELLLTEDAERDLEDIYNYIVEYDSRQKADYVLDRILEVTESLARSPERGLLPRELSALGIQEVPPGLLQAVPCDLPSNRSTGNHLRDRRWKARYAVAVVATGSWRLWFAAVDLMLNFEHFHKC